MRSQRPIKGSPRVPMSTCVLEEIERAIEREMLRYDVSRSFVIATALAFTFNIKTQPDYRKMRVLKAKANQILRKA